MDPLYVSPYFLKNMGPLNVSPYFSPEKWGVVDPLCEEYRKEGGPQGNAIVVGGQE